MSRPSRRKVPKLKPDKNPRQGIGPGSFRSQKKIIQKLRLGRALVVILLIFVILVSLFSGSAVIKFARTEFRDEDVYSDLVKWEGGSNLNVLILGIDEKADDLQFIDAMGLMYIQPQSQRLNLLAVDTDLNVSINEDLDAIDSTSRTFFTFKQLYNYYLAQDNLDGTDIAFQEFLYAIEAELGLKIDRFVVIKKQNFETLTKPLTQAGQDGGGLQYLAAIGGEVDKRLIRQNLYIEKFLLKSDNWVVMASYALFTLQTNDLTDLIETNFTSSEIWVLGRAFSELKGSGISSDITAENEKFLLGNKRFLDKKLFDENIRKLYVDLGVIEEQVRIDVLNGSGRPGLASGTKRILTNHSFNIVSSENSQEEVDHTVLFVPNPQDYPQTIRQLQRFYPDMELRREDYPYRPIGDIVLIVV